MIELVLAGVLLVGAGSGQGRKPVCDLASYAEVAKVAGAPIKQKVIAQVAAGAGPDELLRALKTLAGTMTGGGA